MEFKILYWHWLAFGMLLIALELLMPSFTIFWFGLGAMLVGLLLFVGLELSISLQLLIWAIASAMFTFAWFRWIKPLSQDRTKAGMGREALLGEVGMVLKIPGEGRRGELRFPAPILGDDTWQFLCDEELQVGDRVMVRELSGNTLVVTRFVGTSAEENSSQLGQGGTTP